MSAGERATERVREKLKKIAENAPSYTLMHQVLGNGILPTVSKNDIKLLT